MEADDKLNEIDKKLNIIEEKNSECNNLKQSQKIKDKIEDNDARYAGYARAFQSLLRKAYKVSKIGKAVKPGLKRARLIPYLIQPEFYGKLFTTVTIGYVSIDLS